jgi:thiol:disulfide interchange protein
MKKISAILFLMVMVGMMSFRFLEEPKVIVIVTKANWCGTCKANGTRTVENFMSNNQDSYFQLVANDLTDKTTKKASLESLKKIGYDKEGKKLAVTGVLSFYNAKTKKLLTQISVSKSNEEVTQVMNDIRKQLN